MVLNEGVFLKMFSECYLRERGIIMFIKSQINNTHENTDGIINKVLARMITKTV